MAILVLSSPLPSAPFAAALRAAAPEIAVWTEADDPPPDAVEAILAWRLKPGVLPRYPQLRVLCSTGAGVDKLLSVADLPPGLPVTRVVDPAQAMEMAQHVLACTLQFTRELPRYAAQQARSEWRRHPIRSSGQCRVGILGLGEVGRCIAAAFRAVGYPVAGWSRSRRQVDGVQTYAGAAELPALLGRSDILVCVLPLTGETRGLLGRERLVQLPRGAFLVNVGRGEHVVEADLRALLDEGHLAGAALDVMEREPPPPGNWVWSHPRVAMTPHIASQASFETVAAQCIDALRRARAGLAQPLAVDRGAGY